MKMIKKAAMVEDADVRDRAAIHRKAIADFGGEPIVQFGSYSEYDMVYIYRMPDEKALAANLHLTIHSVWQNTARPYHG